MYTQNFALGAVKTTGQPTDKGYEITLPGDRK